MLAVGSSFQNAAITIIISRHAASAMHAPHHAHPHRNAASMSNVHSTSHRRDEGFYDVLKQP
jgi:hypothetical protein